MPCNFIQIFEKASKKNNNTNLSVTIGYNVLDKYLMKLKKIFQLYFSLVEYLIKYCNIYYEVTPRDVKKLAYDCATRYNIPMPKS